MSGFVQFTFRLSMSVKQEGDWFFAVCPSLDVHSQGRTRAEAKQNLNEAVQLFIESCFERRVLDDVLVDCGFEKADQQMNVNDDEMLEMTLPLLARRHVEARDPITVPPIGTSKCTNVQRRDAYGNWRWEKVCY